MKILAIERELPNASAEAFQHFAEEEALKAWELYQMGLVRELYFRADQSTAVLVLECDSIEHAVKILAELPFTREGLIAFELIPLKAYPGFTRLFMQKP
jgi:muconolactone delta-isomerase